MSKPRTGAWRDDHSVEDETLRRLRSCDEQSVPAPDALFVRRLRTNLTHPADVGRLTRLATSTQQGNDIDAVSTTRRLTAPTTPTIRHRRWSIVDLSLVAAMLVALVGGVAIIAPRLNDEPKRIAPRGIGIGTTATPAAQEDISIPSDTAQLHLSIPTQDPPPEITLRRLTIAPGTAWELAPPTTQMLESGSLLIGSETDAVLDRRVEPGEAIEAANTTVRIYNGGREPATLMQVHVSLGPRGPNAIPPSAPPAGVAAEVLYRGLFGPVGGQTLLLLESITVAPGAVLEAEGDNRSELIVVQTGRFTLDSIWAVTGGSGPGAATPPSDMSGDITVVGPGEAINLRLGSITGRNQTTTPVTLLRLTAHASTDSQVAAPLQASPAAIIPEASDCQVPPLTVADIERLMALPPLGPSAPTLSLAGSQSVDPQTRQAAASTVQEFFACQADGYQLRLLALYSEDFVRRTLIPEDGFRWDPDLETIGTPMPIPEENRVAIVIDDVLTLTDGRIIAFVTGQLLSGAESPMSAGFLLVQQNGRWLVDDIVDPAAMTRTPVP